MSIESELKELVEAFVQASVGLFEITGRYTATFEQGVYACAIAKPSKRIRSALGVDREVLVVASNFVDQQQRTIKLVKREIESSHGRFETTIAVVVHRDNDGNSKLKNWGRDQSLSILPLRRSDLTATPADLERSLCIELYSHDPFDVTGPVSDDANFFGRRDEAIDLARKLQRGQIRSCLGIRKIGKTSIINRVVGEIRSNYDCVCVMIDCSRDDVWSMSAAQLLDSLAISAANAAQSAIPYASLSPSLRPGDLRAARDNLQAFALTLSKPLILIFDEIDYVTPGSPTRSEWRTEFNLFWRNLRSVYQECARQDHQVSILVGGVSTYWFTVESIGGIENAALAFVPEEYLSPMPQGATVAMLRRLGRVAGFQMDDAAADLIAEATGNVPYWARKCCSYIHRHVPILDRPCVIDSARALPLVEAFVSEEGAAISEVALRHLFRVHPNLLPATEQCASGKAKEVSEPLRRILKRYGILAPDDSLSGAMLRRGFAALASDPTPPVDRVSTTTGTTQAQIMELGDWAEELAAIGKRRNILERRLRELALNFLRFDSLSSAKSTDLRERVLAIVPENQRQALLHLTAEEAMNRFLWTDLVKLIAKEWSLFSKLLGDKEQFQRNCEVINDRFDAHAKPADPADFALYRRALRHVEDRLAKLQ
jgi:hypothetical protein